MIKRELLGALGALALLGLGCGANEPQVQSTPTCVGPPTPECIIPVDDGSFVRAAVLATDGVSTATGSYTPGRVCMSGNLVAGPANSTNWGSVLVLPVTDAATRSPFAASSRGVEQVQFTIDPPPPTGLTVAFGAFQRADCLTVPDCLTAADFFLADSNGVLTIVDTARTVTAPLTAFIQPSWGDSNLSFDPDLIASLNLQPQLLPGVALSYDFCVRDIKFLDAGGREVLP
jgi:hypothetical protein